ncbi:MAG TPA: hypothetical protein VHB02_13315 [Acidimicrobiales bacterium]|nr:hypothetical protein [Acidimicrobiales bacterium]
MAGDDRLWKQVAKALRGRPGWTFQATATPGAPPVWCYTDGGAVELSVAVDSGAVRIYLESTDQDVVVADAAQLVDWLAANAAAALRDPKAGLLQRARGGRFFSWD